MGTAQVGEGIMNSWGLDEDEEDEPQTEDTKTGSVWDLCVFGLQSDCKHTLYICSEKGKPLVNNTKLCFVFWKV